MRRITYITLLLVMVLSVGCNQYDRATLARESFTANPPQAVMYTSTIRNSPVSQATWANPPWQYTRNDAYLNVRPTPTRDVADYTVRTYDRMHIYGGRIYDSHSRQVYGWRSGRVVR